MSLRHEQQEAGGRDWRGWQEDGDHLLPQFVEAYSQFALGLVRDKHHGIGAGAGKLDQPNLAVGAGIFLQYRFENLLHALVDWPHQRRAVQHRFGEGHDPLADKVRTEQADQRDESDRNQQTQAGNGELQIFFRIVM